ncbi:4'-phosphopantetheinyl transferase superfamily protein [Alkalimonas amylolytica]|uniref:Enterobactin synthase component D n=1 Tax=Alkalimonas amylolytica TaxID=152573 RepID=A0A1H4G2Z4_ALKAM|nr:4'-phosphopantetheinyl transferase superfamily protein [Alkalimonas amylolytica]
MEVAKDIVGSVLTSSEHQFVGSATNPNPVVLTLIFSAKESLFKALYPEVGCYFDFHAARIKEINFVNCQITLELIQELGPTLRVGTHFSGVFELDSTKVFTIIT